MCGMADHPESISPRQSLGKEGPKRVPARRIIEVGVLAIVLMVAAWLRIDRARADGLTFDEQWHMELSTGCGSPHVTLPLNELIAQAPPVTSLRGAPPFYAVWSHLSGVAHPPLFMFVLRLW